MNDLRELIGKKVEVSLENEEGSEYTHRSIICIVRSFNIDQFYFQEKNEPIYITVEVEPIDKSEEEDEYEWLTKVPLDVIRSVAQ